MIKFYKQIDLTGSDLLITFNSAGLSGNFAASLLIANNNFEHAGFLFSNNLSPFSLTGPNGTTIYNGEIYYNGEKSVTLINFTTGVSKQYRTAFFNELVGIYKAHSMKKIVVMSGIAKEYLNDTELKKTNVDVYYLSNDSGLVENNNGIVNFKGYLGLENKTKPLPELDYMSANGSARYLIKHLDKNGFTYSYLFVYSSLPFDPVAGYVLYNRICNLLTFTNEKVTLPKIISFATYLTNLQGIKLDDTWKILMK
jgi:hypothetical protein